MAAMRIPPLSNWGAFGAGDQLGTLNYLTPEAVLRGSAAIRTGERYQLNLPIDVPTHPVTRRPRFKNGPAYQKVAFCRNELRGDLPGATMVVNDDSVTFATQGSSQWDALVHCGLQEQGVDGVFYNGAGLDAVDERGYAHRNGIDNYAKAGIAGRGVLLDVARMAADGRDDPLPLEHVISPAALQACMRAQGVAMQQGDIVCIRTGWTERYMAGNEEERARLTERKGTDVSGLPRIPGIDGTHAALAHEQKWAAVAADNLGVECIPMRDYRISAHVTMLRNLGLAFAELMWFQDLARACAADRRWEFLFVAVPLWIPGGMGSPANAIAIR